MPLPVSSPMARPAATLPVNCASPLANLITFSGNQCVQGTTTGLDIARVRTDFVNGPDVKISGIDVAINYDFPLDFGDVLGRRQLRRTTSITSSIRSKCRASRSSTAYDAVGFGNYFRDPNTVPEWRANAYANFNAGGFNARYVLSHIDGVTDDRCVGRDPCFSTSAGPTDYGIESGSFTKHDIVPDLRTAIPWSGSTAAGRCRKLHRHRTCRSSASAGIQPVHRYSAGPDVPSRPEDELLDESVCRDRVRRGPDITPHHDNAKP